MTDQRKMKIVKREDIERRRDHERSVEVAHMLLLMDKYFEKARDYVAERSNNVLTKQAA